MASPLMSQLPAPTMDQGEIVPGWNAVALFFNLAAADQPASYAHTTADHVRDWIDDDGTPCATGISRFIAGYWYLLSKGQFACGMAVPRDGEAPVVADVALDDGQDAASWTAIIRAIVTQHAEAVWDAALRPTVDGKRWIPSVVLVQHYSTQATAHFSGWEQTVAGHTYLIGDVTHVPYDQLTEVVDDDGSVLGREGWSLICHEQAHNFLEQDDLYGPSGATGYWDMLGDDRGPGRMPEVCSVFKQAVGWLEFQHVIEGPFVAEQRCTLRPYTTSLDAIKIVPDPHHTPDEFFALEYRKQTGGEPWRPDRHLGDEAGLLIWHFKTRMGLGEIPWTLREAPYMDVEAADFRDQGTTLRLWNGDVAGVLYPHAGNDGFTPFSQPNSDLYGERGSGLSITDIRIGAGGEELSFRVAIHGVHTVGWFTNARARYLTGRFTTDAATRGRELFAYDDRSAALLLPRQAQWVVALRQVGSLGAWALAPDQRSFVADLDGDGLDEVFLRTDTRGTVLKWRVNGFTPLDSHLSTWWVDGDSSEQRIRLLPDGRDAIVSHKGDSIALIEYADGQLVTFAQAQGSIGPHWTIGPDDVLHVGRFTRPDRDEILIVNGDALGIFRWDEDAASLAEVLVQRGTVDGLPIADATTWRVADLDGDGRHELYVRVGTSAAILKHHEESSALRLATQCHDEVPHKDAPANASVLALTTDDRSDVGHFLPDRDLVLHRNATSIHLLRWDEVASTLVVDRSYANGAHPKFTLRDDDRVVIGDFHPVGDDPNKALLGGEADYIGEDQDDVFLYNADETKMIGPNDVRPRPTKDLHQEFAPFWYCDGEFMLQRTGCEVRSVVTLREDMHGRNVLFLDELTGTTMDVDQFCSAIELGLYPEYHVRKVRNRKVPASNPNALVSDNLDRV